MSSGSEEIVSSCSYSDITCSYTMNNVDNVINEKVRTFLKLDNQSLTQNTEYNNNNNSSNYFESLPKSCLMSSLDQNVKIKDQTDKKRKKSNRAVCWGKYVECYRYQLDSSLSTIDLQMQRCKNDDPPRIKSQTLIILDDEYADSHDYYKHGKKRNENAEVNNTNKTSSNYNSTNYAQSEHICGRIPSCSNKLKKRSNLNRQQEYLEWDNKDESNIQSEFTKWHNDDSNRLPEYLKRYHEDSNRPQEYSEEYHDDSSRQPEYLEWSPKDSNRPLEYSEQHHKDSNPQSEYLEWPHQDSNRPPEYSEQHYEDSSQQPEYLEWPHQDSNQHKHKKGRKSEKSKHESLPSTSGNKYINKTHDNGNEDSIDNRSYTANVIPIVSNNNIKAKKSGGLQKHIKESTKTSEKKQSEKDNTEKCKVCDLVHIEDDKPMSDNNENPISEIGNTIYAITNEQKEALRNMFNLKPEDTNVLLMLRLE